MLTYSFQSGIAVPLYEQLYRVIKKDIETKRLEAHTRMPSKRALCDHLKLSQNTIENAYAQLVAEGYLYSLPRRGYFVAELEPRLGGNQDSYYSVAQEKKSSISKSPVYDFKTNVVDLESFPMSSWAKLSREAIRQNRQEMLRPSHAQGELDLRRELVEYLHHYRAIQCHPDQIIIGAGSEYLMGLMVQSLGRESVYAIENPGYPKIKKILNSNGIQTRHIPVDENGMRIDLLEQSETDVVHLTPSHHFPLGSVMPIGRRLQLLKWASAGGGRYILEDDYDSEFRFQGRPIPALQSLDQHQRTIYFNTFAKSLAPSLRLGYAVLPESLLTLYQEKLSFYSCTVSSFEQRILCRFLSGGFFERHLRRMRKLYKMKVEILIQELNKCDKGKKLSISGQNTGLHLILTVDNGLTEKELLSRALKAGVKVYGVSSYYHEPSIAQQTHHQLVLGYAGLSETDLKNAAQKLATAWDL